MNLVIGFTILFIIFVPSQAQQCPNDCYFLGNCTAGNCKCDYGYTGADCSQGTCPNKCFYPNGDCISSYCNCTNFWRGIQCEIYIGLCKDQCSGRGDCSKSTAGYQCECEPNWFTSQYLDTLECNSYELAIPPPKLFIQPTLSSIVANFSLPVVMYTWNNCSGFLSAATIASLGKGNFCLQPSPTTVQIFFGKGHNISRSTMIEFEQHDGQLVKGIGDAENIILGSFPIQTPTTPSPVAAISAPEGVSGCDNVTVDGTVSWKTGEPELNYQWTLDTDKPLSTPFDLSQPRIVLTPTELGEASVFDFGLVVTDFVGMRSSRRLTLYVRPNVISTSVSGGNYHRVTVDSEYTLKGITIVPSCLEVENLIHWWEFRTGSPSIPLSSSDLSKPDLLLPKGSLKVGVTYTIVQNVKSFPLQTVSTSSITVYAVPAPLQVEIAGGSRSLWGGVNITLHSYAYDPNGGNITRKWTCMVEVTRRPCFNTATILGYNQSSVTIRPASVSEPLLPGYSYIFTLQLLSSATPEIAQHSVKIFILSAPPTNTYWIESARDINHIDPNQRQVFELFSQNPIPSGSIEWRLFQNYYGKLSKQIADQFSSVPISDSPTGTGFSNLVLNPGKMKPGVPHQLRALVDGVEVCTLDLRVEDVPHVQGCSIQPATGIAYDTEFTISCYGGYSAHGNSFDYLFSAVIVDGVQVVHLPLSQISRTSSLTTTLPGRNGTATSVFIEVELIDQLSSTVFNFSQVVVGYNLTATTLLPQIRSKIEKRIALQHFAEALTQISFYADLLNNNVLDGISDRLYLLQSLQQVFDKMPITDSSLKMLLIAFGLITDVPTAFNAQSIDSGYNLIVDVVKALLEKHQAEIHNPAGRAISTDIFDTDLYTEVVNVIGDLLVCVNNAAWEGAPSKIYSLKQLLKSILVPISDQLALGDIRQQFWGNRAAVGLLYSRSSQILNPSGGSNYQTLRPPRWYPGLHATSVTISDDAKLEPYLPLTTSSTTSGSTSSTTSGSTSSTTSGSTSSTTSGSTSSTSGPSRREATFSADFPEYVYSVLIWYSENPYPWASRADSDTLELLLYSEDWTELKISYASSISTFLHHPDGWVIPSNYYQEACSIWNNDTLKWDDSYCKLQQGECLCHNGTEFAIQTKFIGSAAANQGPTGDWWASPGMWIAIVVAIICACVGIGCMYFLAWYLKYKLSKMEKDEFY